jgi:imidazolonepropionase-like amidohydrolase
MDPPTRLSAASGMAASALLDMRFLGLLDEGGLAAVGLKAGLAAGLAGGEWLPGKADGSLRSAGQIDPRAQIDKYKTLPTGRNQRHEAFPSSCPYSVVWM